MGLPGFKGELTIGSGPGTVAGKAKDVTPDLSAGDIDISTRSGNGWKEFIQGLKEWSVDVDHLWVPDDAAYTALQTAFLNGTSVDVQFLDETDGYGWSGVAFVNGLKKAEPLDGAQMVSIKLRGTGELTPVTPD